MRRCVFCALLFAVPLPAFAQAPPPGGLADSQVTDEGPPNADWNTVWDVRTSTFEGGWGIEMAIPC